MATMRVQRATRTVLAAKCTNFTESEVVSELLRSTRAASMSPARSRAQPSCECEVGNCHTLDATFAVRKRLETRDCITVHQPHVMRKHLPEHAIGMADRITDRRKPAMHKNEHCPLPAHADRGRVSDTPSVQGRSRSTCRTSPYPDRRLPPRATSHCYGWYASQTSPLSQRSVAAS